MNKKLQEIAFKSGFDFYQDGTQTRITSDKNLEKFAELIVRECIEINKQELAFNAFERLMNKYKDHFGVEE